MAAKLHPSSFLKYALLGDASASGVTGAIMAGGAGFLAGLLNLPERLLLYAGLFLLPYAAIIAIIGTRKKIPHGAVWCIIVLNVLWALESFWILGNSQVIPTTLGYLFVVIQAVTVLGFAIAQYLGLGQVIQGYRDASHLTQ